MPHKTKTGWKWSNIKRKTKGELAKTVYGIWKKNGSKGRFSDFWHGKDDEENTNESEILTTSETTSSVNGIKTINTSRTGSEHMNTKTNNATTLIESWGTPWQRMDTTSVYDETREIIDEGYFDSTEEMHSYVQRPSLRELGRIRSLVADLVGRSTAIMQYCIDHTTPYTAAAKEWVEKWQENIGKIMHCKGFAPHNNGLMSAIEQYKSEFNETTWHDFLNKTLEVSRELKQTIETTVNELKNANVYVYDDAITFAEEAQKAMTNAWKELSTASAIRSESENEHGTTLVESWGTPWQRTTTQLID